MTKEEKLEEAKRLYQTANADQRYVLESLFPELKELGDERIRKELIDYINRLTVTPNNIDRYNAWITWLEKQGNTNETINSDEFAQGVLKGAAINLITWIDYNAAEGNMCLSNTECKDIEDALVSGDWNKIYAYMKKKLERQDEQKHIFDFNANNWCVSKVDGKIHNIYNVGVEPKFQNGQWIVWQDKCYKINYNGCRYELIDQNGLSTSLEHGTIDESAHLWNISDAKNGDVLCGGSTIFIFKDFLSDGSVMSYCDYDTDGGESDAFCPLSMNLMCSKITPATKEQRDQLEKAMANAGYTFDFGKKELKKTEPKSKENKGNIGGFSSNSKWSEEDEKTLNEIFSVAARASLRKSTLFGKSYDYIKWQNWLKSLKPRNMWKPSDEQIKAIRLARSFVIDDFGEHPTLSEILMELEEQLQKIKENKL